MKVLHAVTLHTPTNVFGGPVRVALNLTGGLRARAVDARLVALADGFDGRPPTQVEGVPAHLYPARRLLPLGFSGMTSPRLLAEAGPLVRAVDLVHVHLARDLVTLPVALAALRARRPLVLQTHGMVDPSDRRLARALDLLAVRRVLRRADAVLHLTEHERTDLERVLAGTPVRPPSGTGSPVRPPCLIRLPNGVPGQDSRRAWPSGPATVLYAARMHERKRPADLVAAAPSVLRHRPDTRFLFAGPDEGALAPALRLADELGVRGAVTYLGALGAGEVLRLMRTAHVYVLPSVDEPFPMSVLEAMSVGLPPLVTPSNGLASDIARAGAGRVVGPSDSPSGAAEGIAAAVLDLLDPAVNEASSLAAWRTAREQFSLNGVLDDLGAIYQRVLSPSGVRALG